jgi:hypothetical protein
MGDRWAIMEQPGPFGTTMASMIITFPTAWSHLIGQLVYYMGFGWMRTQ